MHFVYAGFLHYLHHVVGGDTAAGQYLDATLCFLHHLPQGVATEESRCRLPGSEDAMAAADDYLFLCLLPVASFVEGTMEGHFHISGRSNRLARLLHVDVALRGKASYHHGMRSDMATIIDVTQGDMPFFGAVDEIAGARTYQYMGAQTQLFHTILDGSRLVNRATFVEIVAIFHTPCPCPLGMDGTGDGVGAYLYLYHCRMLLTLQKAKNETAKIHKK